MASEDNFDAGDVEDVNVTNKTSGNLAIVSAGLRFDYVNKLYVKFTAESLDGVSITFGDYNATATITDLGNGTYIAYSNAIAATELGNYVTVTLTNGVSTATVDYSAYAYVSAKWGDENEVDLTALEALVRALYFYGKAASALV